MSAAAKSAADLSLRHIIDACGAIEAAARIIHDDFERKFLDRNGVLMEATGASLPAWVTPFHSSVAIPVSLGRYAHTIAHFAGYGADGIRIGLGLMVRFLRRTARDVSLLSMHRLLAVCIQVAMKANCDLFIKNAHIAHFSGVPLAEFNDLEVELLCSIDFCAVLSHDEGVELPRSLAALPCSGAADTGRAALKLLRGTDRDPTVAPPCSQASSTRYTASAAKPRACSVISNDDVVHLASEARQSESPS